MTKVEIPAAILELAHSVADIVRQELGATTRLWIFGSWANGNAAPRSDLDVAVDWPADATIHSWLEVHDRLEKLPTLRSIDLVALNEVDEGQRGRVLATGIEL